MAVEAGRVVYESLNWFEVSGRSLVTRSQQWCSKAVGPVARSSKLIDSVGSRHVEVGADNDCKEVGRQ